MSACALGAALLSACGGGGSSSGSDGLAVPTDSFNVALAWQSLVSAPNSWSASGTGSDGNAYRLDVADAAAAAGNYPVTGTAAQRSTSTVKLFQNGTQVVEGLTEYYFDAGYALIGSRRSGPGLATTCEQVTAYSAPPTAAHVGDHGAHFSGNTLDGCGAGAQVIETFEVTWSIEFEAGITYFCSNTTSTELSPPSTSTESDCLQVSTDGSLGARARVSVASPELTLVLRN